MKLKLLIIACLTLILYSLTLMYAEWNSSQEAIRPYFADIRGPVPLFAINTSLSTFLLWGTSLLFFVTLTFTPSSAAIKQKLFLFSQTIVFAYLGLDDRFMLHERFSGKLGVPDDNYVLLMIGGVNALALFFLGRAYLINLRTLVPLLFAGGFFALMTYVDGFFPYHDMVLRLSVEDLLKVWSGFSFLIFGWTVLSLTVQESIDRSTIAAPTD